MIRNYDIMLSWPEDSANQRLVAENNALEAFLAEDESIANSIVER
jgi:hypothetical protein